MDTGRPSLWNRASRGSLGINNFLVFASSAIATGILSHFIHRYHTRGTHIIYQEVIAVITLFLYLFAMFLPAFKGYRGYAQPLNLILSYLWLTSLIFASQDYSGHRCHYSSPISVNTYTGITSDHCRLKHALQAFQILGFSMLFINSILEALMWAGHRGNQFIRGPDVEKDRPLTSAAERAPVANGGHTTIV